MTAPALTYWKAIKAIIDGLDGMNIRNRIAFYIEFKRRFPDEFNGVETNSLALSRLMTEHGHPLDFDFGISEQESFKLWFFGQGGYLTGRIANPSINLVYNCYDKAKEILRMQEKGLILISGFEPNEAGRKLADEIRRINDAKAGYVDNVENAKIRLMRDGDHSVILHNIGEENLADVRIMDDDTWSDPESTSPLDIPAGEFRSFDLANLKGEQPGRIAFRLFNIEFSRDVDGLGYQDVLPHIRLTMPDGDVLPARVLVNASETHLSEGTTVEYSWKFDDAEESSVQKSGIQAEYNYATAPGTYSVTLTVRADGKDYTLESPVTVKIDPELKPVITEMSATPDYPDRGDYAELTVEADDPSGMGLEYIWYKADPFDFLKDILIGTSQSEEVLFDRRFEHYSVVVRNPHGETRDSMLVRRSGQWHIDANPASEQDWIGSSIIAFKAVGGKNASGSTFAWDFGDGGAGSVL